MQSQNKVFSFVVLSFLLSTKLFAQGEPALAAPQAQEAAKPADSTNITLDFKDADIGTVLRVMSLKSNVNIVAGPEVKGTVTIRLENVPWEKALEVVLRTYGYVFERDGNIIRVTTRDNLAAEPLITQTYVLNYTKAQEVQAAVTDMLTERGRIKVAERTNALVISDIPTNLYSIREIIKKLDKRTPQAFIDSRIVKTSVGSTENLGIEWKTGGTSNNVFSLTGSSRPTTFPFASQPGATNTVDEAINKYAQQFFPVNSSSTTVGGADFPNRTFPLPALATPTNSTYTFGTLSFSGFNNILQMLKSRSNTKVLSNPRVVVLNNQPAEIHVGDNIPLPKFETNETTGRLVVSGFSYDIKTGVFMKVTPHINSEDEILVDLQPSVNSTNGTISFNADLSAPIINETTAKSQVLIRSGETIAIGGLLTDNVQIAEAKVPYLGDMPLLGKLFRSKRQTAGSGNSKDETLFFVTVTTVDTQGQPTGERAEKLKLKKLGVKQETSAGSSPTSEGQKKVESQSLPSGAAAKPAELPATESNAVSQPEGIPAAAELPKTSEQPAQTAQN